MSRQFKNKSVIVTRGAYGLGEAVSRKFAELGARVLVVGVSGDPVPEVAESIRRAGGTAEFYIGDVGNESQAEGCIAKALDEFGSVDILIHLSATAEEALEEPVELEHYRASDFDRLIYDEVRSVFLLTKFAMPYLKKNRGVILAATNDDNRDNLADEDWGTKATYAGVAAWIDAFTQKIAAESLNSGLKAYAVHQATIELTVDALTRYALSAIGASEPATNASYIENLRQPDLEPSP